MVAVDAGLDPQDASAATENGSAIEIRPAGGAQRYDSCVLYLQCGAATGAPSAQTVDLKVQDSPDGSTGWADYTDPDGNGAVTQLTADDTQSSESVNLEGAKRYVRLVRVVGFTGGTSPTIPVGAAVVFGKSQLT